MGNHFKVGPKNIFPQILVFNENNNYLTRWVDKAESSKRFLNEIKELHLEPDVKKQKIKNTPELSPENMAKEIADELISELRKYKYFL